MIRETVTVLTPAMVEHPYSGELEPSWVAGVSRRDVVCLVAPSSSGTLIEVDRAPTDSDFTLYFDADPQIETRHRVEVRGLECLVDGRAAEWRWPANGELAGWAVRVSIREG